MVQKIKIFTTCTSIVLFFRGIQERRLMSSHDDIESLSKIKQKTFIKQDNLDSTLRPPPGANGAATDWCRHTRRNPPNITSRLWFCPLVPLRKNVVTHKRIACTFIRKGQSYDWYSLKPRSHRKKIREVWNMRADTQTYRHARWSQYFVYSTQLNFIKTYLQLKSWIAKYTSYRPKCALKSVQIKIHIKVKIQWIMLIQCNKKYNE